MIKISSKLYHNPINLMTLYYKRNNDQIDIMDDNNDQIFDNIFTIQSQKKLLLDNYKIVTQTVTKLLL